MPCNLQTLSANRPHHVPGQRMPPDCWQPPTMPAYFFRAHTASTASAFLGHRTLFLSPTAELLSRHTAADHLPAAGIRLPLRALYSGPPHPLDPQFSFHAMTAGADEAPIVGTVKQGQLEPGLLACPTT